jgi:hypothetical protein
MKSWFLVFALTAGLPTACLVGQPSMEPVPGKWLHDGELVAEEVNFAIQPPTIPKDWRAT